MKVIGITGGIGAGKSRVLDYLADAYGASVCRADDTARALQKKGTRCYRRIVEHFGSGILDPEGRLDREKLARIVFSDASQLRVLNEIVHPAVKEKVKELIRRREKEGSSLFVLEAALLLEENYGAVCDEIWYIYSDDETRKRRLMASRGYSEEKIRSIFAAQLPSSEFFDNCDRAIDNCSSFEETCGQIDEILENVGLEKREV